MTCLIWRPTRNCETGRHISHHLPIGIAQNNAHYAIQQKWKLWKIREAPSTHSTSWRHSTIAIHMYVYIYTHIYIYIYIEKCIHEEVHGIVYVRANNAARKDASLAAMATPGSSVKHQAHHIDPRCSNKDPPSNGAASARTQLGLSSLVHAASKL